MQYVPEHVVVISNAVHGNVLGHDCRGHVTQIPNAVGAKLFQARITKKEARQKLGLPVDCPMIGVPGTLRAGKGTSVLSGLLRR